MVTKVTPAQPDPTTAETRQELNCSNTTVFNLLNSGELDGYYVGRTLRVTRESIDALKRRHAYTKPGTKPATFRNKGAA